MSSTDSTIRTMLANGNVQAILDMVGTDRREDFPLRSIRSGVADSAVTLAQVGQALIVADEHSTMVTVHEHDATKDAECWEHLVTETRTRVEAHNTMADGIRADAGAQRLLTLGLPEDMVAGAWQMRQKMLTQEPTPDTDGMPAIGNPFATPAPVTAPVADSGPVGFYL
jgi:hypothetical protein